MLLLLSYSQAEDAGQRETRETSKSPTQACPALPITQNKKKRCNQANNKKGNAVTASFT